MTRIVFMGTPEFAVPVLQVLLQTQRVVGVVTQPDRPAGRGQIVQPSPVKAAALAANVPVYQPGSLRKPESAESIAAWQPEIIVVAAYGQILRPHLLQLPPKGCLNVHASLLPRWRGAAPMQAALLAGDAQTGISLMQMDEGMDTGPVYVQAAIPIAPDETAATLHDKLAALGGEVLARYLPAILAGELRPQVQAESQATLARLIQKEDGRLRWEDSAESLDRHIRAMTPWPGAFTFWRGQLLKILAAHPAPDPSPSPAIPGQVTAWGDHLLAATGQGRLALDRLQLAGKRPSTAAEFLNGHPDFNGACLDSAA